jgi:hypothetical protein
MTAVGNSSFSKKLKGDKKGKILILTKIGNILKIEKMNSEKNLSEI